MGSNVYGESHFSRRQVLAAGGAAAILMGVAGVLPGSAEASPKDVKKILAEMTGGEKPGTGRVHIDLPPYTEYATQVHITIAVDSPMSEDDYVKAIHVLGERNTVPEIGTYHLTPYSGKAEISTRIRVARTQVIVVAAEMSDGSVHVGKARCKVARGAGGCG